MEYLLKQYGLHQGALEIQYIEEFFLDFPRKKTAAEVIARLNNRDHQILMAEAPLPDDPGMVVPVSYKIVHEVRAEEEEPKPRRETLKDIDAAAAEAPTVPLTHIVLVGAGFDGSTWRTPSTSKV